MRTGLTKPVGGPKPASSVDRPMPGVVGATLHAMLLDRMGGGGIMTAKSKIGGACIATRVEGPEGVIVGSPLPSSARNSRFMRKTGYAGCLRPPPRPNLHRGPSPVVP
jgi:hypothetical protein